MCLETMETCAKHSNVARCIVFEVPTTQTCLLGLQRCVFRRESDVSEEHNRLPGRSMKPAEADLPFVPEGGGYMFL